jgi:hypothetical protein
MICVLALGILSGNYNKSILNHLNKKIISVITLFVGRNSVWILEPIFDGSEALYLKEGLDSVSVSSVQKFTKSIKIAKILYYSIRKLVF